MTDTDVESLARAQSLGGPHTPAAFSRSAAGDEWIASTYDDVRAVLADERFEVPTVEEAGAPGTISWFRASVSRFTNGAEHQLRRTRVVEALQLLEPAQLRSTAHERALAILNDEGRSGARVDVMSQLARRVPMATMAGHLGIADPEGAAEAAIAMAAAYAPGSDAAGRPAADAATARLVGMLAPVEMAEIVARISLMIQGCDATAGLIGTALQVLQDTPDIAAAPPWSTDAVMTEVLRHRPVLRASRRRARSPIDFDGCEVSAGDTVDCDIEAANRDPAVFEQPSLFDPARPKHPSLTFGYGYRPCPGQSQALMLAAGVVDAVRQRCAFLPGGRVDYEPSAALRIPIRLEVVLS